MAGAPPPGPFFRMECASAGKLDRCANGCTVNTEKCRGKWRVASGEKAGLGPDLRCGHPHTPTFWRKSAEAAEKKKDRSGECCTRVRKALKTKRGRNARRIESA